MVVSAYEGEVQTCPACQGLSLVLYQNHRLIATGFLPLNPGCGYFPLLHVVVRFLSTRGGNNSLYAFHWRGNGYLSKQRCAARIPASRSIVTLGPLALQRGKHTEPKWFPSSPYFFKRNWKIRPVCLCFCGIVALQSLTAVWWVGWVEGGNGGQRDSIARNKGMLTAGFTL